METENNRVIKITENFPKNLYEKAFWGQNLCVAGVDEVGRGCTAGPVVTAAAILKHSNLPKGLLRDSKELSQKELKTAYNWIIKNSWYGIGVANHRAIDNFNIYQTTQKAMKRALAQLFACAPRRPEKILIDAMPLQPETFYPTILYFTKGESKSSSIAAASIIAKVTRDRIMGQLSDSFTHYQLAKHKGYGTKLHKEAILTNGMSIIHRKTFLGGKNVTNKQQSLFC